MSNPKVIHIVLFGIGNVGGTLINQINKTRPKVLQQLGVQIKITVIANSKLAFYNKDGISNAWQSHYKTFSIPYKVEEVINFVKREKLDNLIAIDATSSSTFVKHYNYLIENGFHIISANKLANTWEYSFYEELRNSLKKHNKRFLYETNVGAGLPVIGTLNDLINSGDRIIKIEGVLSGSLSFIFNSFKEGVLFSDIVKEAKKLGYTEPDPRVDLNGIDVRRKLIILARETGLSMEQAEVDIENILPQNCQDAKNIDELMLALENANSLFEDKRATAAKDGKVLRMVAKLEKGKASIGLQAVDAKHPFYSLNGSDNMIVFTTERYKERPLVIRGPGAGAEVTAAGVFAEIITIGNFLS